MRGVNLRVFDFDYDLTWAAFFLNANEKVYGRYGGRDADAPDKHLSLAGLKYAMRLALAAYQREPNAKPDVDVKPAHTVEQFPAAKKGHCIHCHQVYEFRREEMKSAGTWRLDDVWVYPLPENVGLTLERDRGNRVQAVKPGSPARRAGLQAGDMLQSLNGLPVASFADAQYALHRGPAQGTILVCWQRGRETRTARLRLEGGWRKTDISWRASMWGLEPRPGVWGFDLSVSEKKALGLGEKALAFRQAMPVGAAARAAGIQPRDIILGIDNQVLEMTMAQFNAYIRVTRQVGEEVRFNILRDGKRLDLPMRLPQHPGD
jgi:serine protease Do